jgi:hypothetical protein
MDIGGCLLVLDVLGTPWAVLSELAACLVSVPDGGIVWFEHCGMVAAFLPTVEV